MTSESITSPITSAANLIHPPLRSAIGGTAVICAVAILLSTVIAIPNGMGLRTVAPTAFLALCAMYLRSTPAIHFSLFVLTLFTLPVLAPVIKCWPLGLLVPLLVYAVLVGALPPLRQSFGWLRRGRFGNDILRLILATMFISGAALVIWYVEARPDIHALLRFMPPMPLWLYPFAGLGFAMGNAALEEAIFRGIVMDALDSALGPGRASVALQAAPFALLHFHGGFPSGWWGLCMTYIYGIMLGILRRRSQGMLAPWMAHVGADAVIFVILAWIVLK